MRSQIWAGIAKIEPIATHDDSSIIKGLGSYQEEVSVTMCSTPQTTIGDFVYLSLASKATLLFRLDTNPRVVLTLTSAVFDLQQIITSYGGACCRYIVNVTAD